MQCRRRDNEQCVMFLECKSKSSICWNTSSSPLFLYKGSLFDSEEERRLCLTSLLSQLCCCVEACRGTWEIVTYWNECVALCVFLCVADWFIDFIGSFQNMPTTISLVTKQLQCDFCFLDTTGCLLVAMVSFSNARVLVESEPPLCLSHTAIVLKVERLNILFQCVCVGRWGRDRVHPRLLVYPHCLHPTLSIFLII